jgi:hypothetical protein
MTADHSHAAETFSATGVYSAAQAEAGKIHAHRTDLKDATVNLAGRRESWEQQISESNRTLHNIRNTSTKRYRQRFRL